MCSVHSLRLLIELLLAYILKKLYKTQCLTVSVKGACPDGTFTYGNSCYLEFNIRATWAEASVSRPSNRQTTVAYAGKLQCHFSRLVSIVTSALYGASRQQGWSIYHLKKKKNLFQMSASQTNFSDRYIDIVNVVRNSVEKQHFVLCTH